MFLGLFCKDLHRDPGVDIDLGVGVEPSRAVTAHPCNCLALREHPRPPGGSTRLDSHTGPFSTSHPVGLEPLFPRGHALNRALAGHVHRCHLGARERVSAGRSRSVCRGPRLGASRAQSPWRGAPTRCRHTQGRAVAGAMSPRTCLWQFPRAQVTGNWCEDAPRFPPASLSAGEIGEQDGVLHFFKVLSFWERSMHPRIACAAES